MKLEKLINELRTGLLVDVTKNILILVFLAAWSTSSVWLWWYTHNKSAVFVLIIFIAAVVVAALYRPIRIRLRHKWRVISFLQEDSASKSFDSFAHIVRGLVVGCNDKSAESLMKNVVPEVKSLVARRRQPMQIIFDDCLALLNSEKKNSPGTPPLHEQICYYLDFMRGYKKMALPRIVQQTCLYIESFHSIDNSSIQDYIIIYGHSTVVISSIIKSYEIRKFPIVIVKDRQYDKQSADEHKIVCKELKKVKIEFILITFSDFKKLFDQHATSITGDDGNEITLHKYRRLQFFIGCERIDSNGNILIPSYSNETQADTFRFFQEISSHANRPRRSPDIIARIVVLAESFKVRDFDMSNPLERETQTPLRKMNLQTLLYLIGIRRRPPNMPKVSLIVIKSKDIYAHINELGIFPCIAGKFNLAYCINVFLEDSRLRSLFSRKQSLRYQLFDEIEAVLLDLNGVVLDDERIHFMAFSEVVKNMGIELSLSDYNNFCAGRNDTTGLKNIIDKNGVNADIEKLLSRKHEAYIQKLNESDISLDPAISRLLVELHSLGYKLAIVTASSKLESTSILNRFQIMHFFDVVITDDDVAESKPSTEGFELAAKLLNVETSRCLVVEDSIINAMNVKALGMKAVTVRGAIKDNQSDFENISTINELLMY